MCKKCGYTILMFGKKKKKNLKQEQQRSVICSCYLRFNAFRTDRKWRKFVFNIQFDAYFNVLWFGTYTSIYELFFESSNFWENII